MKRWPLRWKIAIYAAALGIVATIAGAGTTWVIMHYWELAAFDRRLTTDAEELFRDIDHFEGGPSKNSSAFNILKESLIVSYSTNKNYKIYSGSLASRILPILVSMNTHCRS